MTTYMRIQRNCSLASQARKWEWPNVPNRFRNGGRVATIRATLEQFARRVGNPHVAAPAAEWRDYKGRNLVDGAGKVSAIWYFDTPRGPVQVSDYWWNKPDELSVRAIDVRAMRWFRRWCKINDWTIE